MPDTLLTLKNIENLRCKYGKHVVSIAGKMLLRVWYLQSICKAVDFSIYMLIVKSKMYEKDTESWLSTTKGKMKKEEALGTSSQTNITFLVIVRCHSPMDYNTRLHLVGHFALISNNVSSVNFCDTFLFQQTLRSKCSG